MGKNLPYFDEALAWKYKKQLEKVKLKNGDIVLFRTPGWVGWMIRLLTCGIVNHAGLIVDKDRMLLLHARSRYGVITQPLYEYMAESPNIRTWIKRYGDKKKRLTKKAIETIINYAISRIHAPYDHIAIGHLFFRMITIKVPLIRRIFKRLPIIQHRLEHFCSELIELSFNKINVTFRGKHHSSSVTPHDVMKSNQLTLVKQFK